jgi:hypothetical protein
MLLSNLVMANEYVSSKDLLYPSHQEIEQTVSELIRENGLKADNDMPSGGYFICKGEENINIRPYYVKNDYHVLVTVTTNYTYRPFWSGVCSLGQSL